MNQEKLVTSIHVSKILKSLGFNQDTYFQWVDGVLWDRTMQSDYETPNTISRDLWIGAFTVTELGEYLKDITSETMDSLPDELTPNTEEEIRNFLFHPDNWAKVLIFLLENKLITI